MIPKEHNEAGCRIESGMTAGLWTLKILIVKQKWRTAASKSIFKR
jgi:hypothetical protein